MAKLKPVNSNPFETAQASREAPGGGQPKLKPVGHNPFEETPDWNKPRAAAERTGDLAGGFLRTADAIGQTASEALNLGGFVWEGDQIIPDYRSSEEMEQWRQRNTGGRTALQRAAGSLEGFEAGYVPEHTWEDVKQEFGDDAVSADAWGKVAGYAAEQGIKSVPDMVFAALNLPGYAASRSGEIGQERARNKGKERADPQDVAEAAPFALGSAFLERIVPAKMLGKFSGKASQKVGQDVIDKGTSAALKHVAKQGAKGATQESVTEAIQEGVIEYAGEKFGTDAKMSLAESLDRAAGGAVAGGGYGAPMGAAGGVADLRNRGQGGSEQADSRPPDQRLQEIEQAGKEAQDLYQEAVNQGDTELATALKQRLEGLRAEYVEARKAADPNYYGDLDPMAEANRTVEEAGERAKANGGDALEAELAKAEAAAEVMPAAAAQQELDRVFATDPGAPEFQRAARDYTDAITPEQAPQLTTDGTIYASEAEDIKQAREQRQADTFSAFYGQEGRARMRPEEGEYIPREQAAERKREQDALENRSPKRLTTENAIYGERPPREFTPEPNEYEGVGQNVVNRMAEQPVGIEATPGVQARQYSAADLRPDAIWTGKRGDGYPNAQAAEKGRQRREKAQPNLEWQVEQMPSGRFQVAGYEPGRAQAESKPDQETSPSQAAASPSLAPASPSQAAANVRGYSIDSEWTTFTPESGTQNVPRADMPQVKAEHRGALANFLRARGVEGTEKTVPAASLKPTQAEFSEAKVQKAKEFEGGDRAILVSSDGHILDGHHQWLARRDQGEDVRTIELNAPIQQLLQQAREFPSSEQEGGTQQAGQSDPQAELSAQDRIAIERERQKKARQKRDRVNPDRDSLVRAIGKRGGLSKQWMEDVTGDTKNVNLGGGFWLFRDGGTSPDDMASMMNQDGYLTDPEMESSTDTGGVETMISLIQDELAGRGKRFVPESKAAEEQMLAELDAQIEAMEGQRESQYAEIAQEHGQEAADLVREYDEWQLQDIDDLYQQESDLEQEQQEQREATAEAAARDERIREAAGAQERASAENEGFQLDQESEDARRAREAQEQDAEQERSRAERRAEREQARRREQAIDQQAATDSVDRFELGQSVEQQLSGQDTLLDPPSQESAIEKAERLGRESPDADVQQIAREVRGEGVSQDKLYEAIHRGQYEAIKEVGANLAAPVRESDIGLDLATRAHSGTSHTPGRRGQSVVQGYVRTMVDAWQKAEPKWDDKEAFAERFRDFRDGYIKRHKAYLQASSRVMSPMIAGPSNFPTRSNQKRGETADKRSQEAADWYSKGLKRLMRGKVEPKTPAGELEAAKEKLNERLDLQERMKAANKALRAGDDGKLQDLGFTDAQAQELKKPDFAGRTGFADYQLRNNNAEIRRLRGRVSALESRVAQQGEAGPDTVAFDGGEVELDHEAGRLRIRHDSKPDAAVRERLKASGFRWSRNNMAWQRKLTENARADAERITGAEINSDDALFAFAGEQSETADTQTLADAREMAEAGQSNEAIRQKTGWFRGDDGKWRYEISDDQASLRPALRSLRSGPFEARPMRSVTYRQHDDGTYSVNITPVGAQRTDEIISLERVPEDVVGALLPGNIMQKVRQGAGRDSVIGSDLNDAKEIAQGFDFDGFNALPLDQALDHPSLFAAYPQLRDAMVQVDPSIGRGGSFSMMDNGDPVIRIGTADQLSTILHEVQHGIQQIEGFATGGRTSQFEGSGPAPETIRAAENLLEAERLVKDADSTYQDLLESGALGDDQARQLRSVVAGGRLNEALEMARQVQRENIPAEEKYRRLAGEIEARNVQSRRNMTDRERALLPPDETRDVPPDDVIVTFNGVEMENAPLPSNLDNTTATRRNRAPVSEAQAREVIDRISGDWLGNNRPALVETFDDLPASIKRQARDQNAEGKVKGAFQGDRLYVVRDKHTTAQDLEETVFHEAYGHLGFSKLFGQDIVREMNKLFMGIGGNRGLNELAQRHGINMSAYAQAGAKKQQDGKWTAEQRNRMMTEELLAHLAQDNRPGIRRRAREIIGAIKQMLRKRGFNILGKVSDNELFALLRRAREAVQTDAEPGPGANLVMDRETEAQFRDRPESDDAGGPLFRQQDQTQTPEFQRWFGGSKVVDENGDPLVVYHGTSRDIDSFRSMAWASADPSLASQYAEMRDDLAGGGGNVLPVYMKVERPFDGDALDTPSSFAYPDGLSVERFIDQLVEQSGVKGELEAEIRDAGKAIKAAGRREESGPTYSPQDFWNETSMMFGSDGAKAIRKAFDLAGFDGVRFTEQGAVSYGAFSPEQIKSATGNRGTFDPDDPNIMFRQEEETNAYDRAFESLGNKDKTVFERAKQTLKREMTPGGLLPRDVFSLKLERDFDLNGMEFDIANRLGHFDNAVKKAYGKPFKSLTDEQKSKINEILGGSTVDKSIPPAVREEVYKMRLVIRGLSEQYAAHLEKEIAELREQGSDEAAESKAQLFETIIENLDTYVHRSYRAFDDPKWPSKVSREVYDDAARYLEQQYAGDGEVTQEVQEKAARKLELILEEGTAFDSMEAFIKESKLGAKDLSVLQRRKQIAPEIRALLGEYKDPKVNFSKTVTKMSRLVFNQRFLDQVKEAGMGENGFLFTEEDRPLDATRRIAADASEVYAPLNGLYTYPEIEQAFKDALGKEQMADWFKTIIRLNGMVKYGKTVLSPTTALRNWMSAGFFAAANGHFDLRQMKKSTDSIKEYFTHGKGKAEYLRKLKKLGVIYDTPYAGEMMDLLADSQLETALYDKKPFTGLRKANEFARKFYQYGDDFWKIMGFENEKAALIKHKGLSEAAAEKEAAERIRNTYPTYSMTGRFVQRLRRFPLAGTFVSFPAEIVRTSYHIMRYLRQDLRDTPALGRRKVAGFAIASGMVHGLQTVAMAWMGMDDDEEEAFRDLAAPWNKNSNIVPLGRNDKGEIRLIDMSFLDPYNYWKRPINAMLRDEPVDETVKEVAREVFTPFFGQDIAFGTLMEAINNEKDSGGRVFNPDAMPMDQTMDIANHLRKALQPGIANNIERLYRASSGQVSASGTPYKVGEEMAGVLGFRVTTFDPRGSIYYKSFEFQDRKRNATRILSSVARNPNEVDDDKLKRAYRLAQETRHEAYEDMIQLVSAATKSGLTRREVASALRNSGVGKRDSYALAMGRVPPWVPSQTMMRNAVKKAQVLFDDETAREFRRREGVIQEAFRESSRR